VSLKLEIASCVRTSAVSSTCVKCVDICPTNAIELSPHLPAFMPQDCVECGGCVGVCPTSAFSLSTFSAINFAFEQFEAPSLISCKTNVPCLAIFGAEDMLSLALGGNLGVMMDIGHCGGCDIAEKLYPQILSNVQEANFLLTAMGKPAIELVDKKEEPKALQGSKSRREFLENIKPANLALQKAKFDSAVSSDELKTFGLDTSTISKIKNKQIPDKRKLLFAILKREKEPLSTDTISGENISFISQKYIDSSCTNCQMCYRICPTGALGAASNLSQINFDAMLCVKCHLCHDVCLESSIHLQPTFELKEFFAPTQRVLASFNIKRCNECGNHFTYSGEGEVICKRCKTEEDEAIFLHQNAKNL